MTIIFIGGLLYPKNNCDYLCDSSYHLFDSSYPHDTSQLTTTDYQSDLIIWM